MGGIMNKNHLQLVLFIGAIWGFCEAALGIYVKGVCGYQMTGSVMTAFAMFFMAIGYTLSSKHTSLIYMLLLAISLKITSAFLLGKPLIGGVVANPVYAFITEALSLAIIFYLIGEINGKNVIKNSIYGGLATLLAVNLFPFVGTFTGNIACNTNNYPWALLYAPVSVGMSLVLFPLAIYLGDILREKAEILETNKMALVVVRVSIVFIIFLSIYAAK